MPQHVVLDDHQSHPVGVEPAHEVHEPGDAPLIHAARHLVQEEQPGRLLGY